MNFEKVREAVLAEARREADARVAEARRQAEALLQQARKAGEASVEEGVREARMRAERETSCAVGRARLQGRLRVLAARNEVLDRVFRRAEEIFLGLDEQEYLSFLRAWLAALPPSVGGVLRVRPDDVAHVEGRFLREVNAARPEGGRFTEVVGDRAVAAGFVVEGENYVLDGALARRLARLRAEAAGSLAQEIFGK